MNGCVDIDSLRGNPGVIDADGEVCVGKRDDFEGAVVKVVSHGGVGGGKRCGRLPGFIPIESGQMLL